MITFDKVSKHFQPNNGPATVVLSEINISIQAGEFVCILGPSGCGKTTLLNLIAGFILPSSGQVLLEGVKILAPGPDRGVVFQDATLFPWLTVLKNVAFGLKLKGIKDPELENAAQGYLEIIGLSKHADKYPYALSGGMRQRVAIARVLALEPKVLLMDEPFSALDANTRERLQDELLRVWMDRHHTVVYVTHSVEEAVYLADRIIILGHADSSIFEEIHVTQNRPRNRSDAKFLSMLETLRSHLAAQPCCIQIQS
jgi:NitT/TauT family transport system ATP-binding protein